MRKLKKHFVSDIDKKLAEFNASNPKSASQQAEIEKYRKIFELRDNADTKQDFQGDIWHEDEDI